MKAGKHQQSGVVTQGLFSHVEADGLDSEISATSLDDLSLNEVDFNDLDYLGEEFSIMPSNL